MVKKTSVIYTGGTFLSEDSEIGRVTTGKLDGIQGASRELKESFAFDESQILSIDSSDLQPEHLERVKNHIMSQEETGEYSGYVVVHGTDTMEYSGSYLSLTLPHVKKPIVLTGSMISVNEEGTDGFRNFHNAVVVSQQDILGTFIMFGKNGTQANKTIKQNSDSFDAFDSPGYAHAFDVDYQDRELQGHNTQDPNMFSHTFLNNTYSFLQNGEIISNLRNVFCKNVKDNLASLKHLNTNVGYAKLYPGFKYDLLDKYIDENHEGLIIEGFGDGNMPQHKKLQSKVDALIANKALVVLRSQCHQGELTHKYAGGKALIEKGAISARNLTIGSTLMKLMLVLGEKQGNQQSDLLYMKKLFGENHAGEYLK